MQQLDDVLADLRSQGIDLGHTRSYGNMDLHSLCSRIIDRLTAHLKARFPEMGKFSAFGKVLNMHRFPESLAEIESSNFGMEPLNILLDLYASAPCEFQPESTADTFQVHGRAEWLAVRLWLWKRRNLTKTVPKEYDKGKPVLDDEGETVMEEVKVSMQEILQDFLSNESLRAMYPVFSFLIHVFLTLAVSSADAERGFSLMRLIKTYLRNRMCQATLQQIMMIKFNGRALDLTPSTFNFQSAALYFLLHPDLTSDAAGKLYPRNAGPPLFFKTEAN